MRRVAGVAVCRIEFPLAKKSRAALDMVERMA